jgi:hypothetical protein
MKSAHGRELSSEEIDRLYHSSQYRKASRLPIDMGPKNL